MKKNLLTLLAFIAIATSQGQIHRNSTLLGGTLSFASQKNSEVDFKRQTALISLSGGKAIRENLVVGMLASYQTFSEKNLQSFSDTFSTKSRTFSVGAFCRQYKNLLKNLYFFGEASALFSASRQNTDYKIANDYVITGRGVGVSLAPGFSYQVLRKLQLELLLSELVALNYSAATTRTENSSEAVKSNNIYLYSNFSASNILSNVLVGFRFIF